MEKPVVVVVAAGIGSRLQPFTNELPKCMLEVQGKTILRRALDTFRNLRIAESIVVGGFKADMLDLPADSRLVLNDRYKSNGILHSLAYARPEMNGANHVISSYSDIIFRRSVVEQLLRGYREEDIVIVVDQDWKKRYDGRMLHPLSQGEAAKFDERQKLQMTGKDLLTPERDSQHWGEFIGMLRLSRRGNELFWDIFDEIDARLGPDDSFQQAPAWKLAYLTDLLQEMVDRGIEIRCAVIQGGWVEIDTSEDYEYAQGFDFSEGVD